MHPEKRGVSLHALPLTSVPPLPGDDEEPGQTAGPLLVLLPPLSLGGELLLGSLHLQRDVWGESLGAPICSFQ